MFQLINNLFILIFIYRIHKLFFNEWSGWYVFNSVWLFLFLTSISVLATPIFFFLTMWQTPIFCIICCVVGVLVIISLSWFLLTLGIIHGHKEEFWWGLLYHYYKYYISFFYQSIWLNKFSSSTSSYSTWYLGQTKQKIIIYIVFIICGLIAVWVLLYANLGYYFTDYFANYIISIFFTFYINVVELFLYLFLSILGIQILIGKCWHCALKFITFEKMTGSFYCKHQQLPPNVKKDYSDYLRKFVFRNYYLSKICNNSLYELPVNWYNWHLFVVDSYNSVYYYLKKQFILKLMYPIIKKIYLHFSKSRRGLEFTAGYSYFLLEVEELYG